VVGKFVYVPASTGTQIVSTHGGMARLSWPEWLVTYRDGLPACRHLPIKVL